MSRTYRLFFSVGEESADLHASRLCHELRRRQPNIEMYGFGGHKMEAEGFEVLYPLPDLALIGFVEVVKHLPQIYKVRAMALKAWEERRPDAVVLIDYPGFNLRLAKLAHERDIPVLYYISPQVWAWKEKRVELMRRVIDRLFVIFPFEETYFLRHRVNAVYVGHPLIERIQPILYSPEVIQEKLRNPIIGLMPGSRRNEIRHMLPVMIEAAKRLREQIPQAKFVFPLADPLPESFLSVFQIPEWIEVCRDQNYERRRQFTFAWTASGTATVENALLGIPMAVVFRTGPLNMFLGRRLVRINYIGMVNLIAQKGICPEFVQEQYTPAMLSRYAEELLTSPARYQEMIEDLAQVRKKVGEAPASIRTAKEIFDFLESQRVRQ